MTWFIRPLLPPLYCASSRYSHRVRPFGEAFYETEGKRHRSPGELAVKLQHDFADVVFAMIARGGLQFLGRDPSFPESLVDARKRSAFNAQMIDHPSSGDAVQVKSHRHARKSRGIGLNSDTIGLGSRDVSPSAFSSLTGPWNSCGTPRVTSERERNVRRVRSILKGDALRIHHRLRQGGGGTGAPCRSQKYAGRGSPKRRRFCEFVVDSACCHVSQSFLTLLPVCFLAKSPPHMSDIFECSRSNEGGSGQHDRSWWATIVFLHPRQDMKDSSESFPSGRELV